MLLLYWNIKKKGSPEFFLCKSFRESSNSHARSRAFKNPDTIISTVAHDLLRLPLTIACDCASSYCIRSDVQKRFLLRTSFSSRQRQPSGPTLKDVLPASDYISHIFIEKQRAKV